MPNGNKNNGKKEIELLPTELRRPEERKKREERPEVKLFVPPVQEKTPKPSFLGKFFGAKEAVRQEEKSKVKEADLSVFGMQKETKQPSPPPPKPQPVVPQEPRPALSPKPQPVFLPKKESLPPPKVVQPQTQPVRKGIPPVKNRFGITLIPEEAVSPEEARRPRQKAILVAIIVILVLVLGGSFGLLKWYQGKFVLELENIEKDIASIEKQITSLDEAKNRAEILQKQFVVADKLLAKHVYWTEVFSFMEKNTVPDVYFKNFVGGVDGSVSLSGIGKSYRAVAEQIVSLREAENAEKISITSASASVAPTGETTEVNFDAKLKLKPEIFLKQ
jgi:hypothetical protein